MKTYITLFLVVIFTVTSTFSQSRSERKNAKKQQIEKEYLQTKALIESKTYQFVAEFANPLDNDATNVMSQLRGGGAVSQGNRINLFGHSNFVKIDGTSSDIALPYFGRGFVANPADATSGGIQFNGNIDDYSIDFNERKNRIDVRFSSKSGTESNNFQFTINSDGSARLTVSSSDRQTISYNGKISELKMEKE